MRKVLALIALSLFGVGSVVVGCSRGPTGEPDIIDRGDTEIQRPVVGGKGGDEAVED